MLSGSCGTRDEPYIPRRRADASVLKRGLSWRHLLNIYKLKATSCGLFCIRKPCPRILVWNGMQFPLGTQIGSEILSEVPCIPFLDRIMGRNFPLERLWESVSHFDRPEWDALSAKHLNGKLRPIPKANSGTQFPRPCPSGKPVPLWTHPGMELSAY